MWRADRAADAGGQRRARAVEPLLEAAAAAGATGIGGIALHLRGDVKKLFFDFLRSYRPDLVALYEELNARGAYAPMRERNRRAAFVRRDPEGTWPSRFRERAREPPAEREAAVRPPRRSSRCSEERPTRPCLLGTASCGRLSAAARA